MESLNKQVIARRDDMFPPIAADLRPCADGSYVRTALVIWPRRCAPSWPRLMTLMTPTPGGTDRQTDRQTNGRTAASFNAPLRRGHNKEIKIRHSNRTYSSPSCCCKAAGRVKLIRYTVFTLYSRLYNRLGELCK